MEKKQTHIVYGFITGMVTVVFYLVIYLAGATFKPGMQYVPFIPFFVGVVINNIAFSKANGGAVTFGNVFTSGFKASALITLLIILWVVISIYLFPDMKEKALEVARKKMAEDPHMTDEIMVKNMLWVKNGYTTMLVSSTVFTELIAGAIFSLIGAAAAKKNAI